MKKLCLIMILTLVTLAGAPTLQAQKKEKPNREQWMTEMRQYKRSYLAKELNLSKEQQEKFFPVYEEMEDKNILLDEDARRMEKEVSQNASTTDADYCKAAETIYDNRVRAAQNEREYMDKFKAILTPRQLFELKIAERKFSRDIMKQHNRIRQNRDTAGAKR